MQTYLVLIVLAGIVAMDTTSGPQVLISEPVVSCSALGFLFGRPEAGLMIGIFFQLLWLGDMPLGGARLTDSKMASFIAASSLFTAAGIFNFTEETVIAAVFPALFFGLIAGIIGLSLTTLVRNINGKRSENMISRLERGERLSINRWHLSGVGSSFLRGAFMALVLVPAGTLLCGIISLLPGSIVTGISLSASMIWGTVCASAIIVYWLKGNKKPLMLGSVGGLIWVLMIISRKG